MNGQFGCYQCNASRALIPLLVLAALLLGQAAANAATGKIFFNYSTTMVEVSGNFFATGTHILLSDTDKPAPPIYCPNAQVSSSYWNGLQGIGDLAQLYYTVDGVYKDMLHIVQNGINGFNELGKSLPFSASVDITGLDPSIVHDITVHYQDVFGYRCDGLWWGGLDLDDRRGEVAGDFASKKLKFKIVIPQSCPLKQNFGSSANVNTGNLADQLNLFSVRGNGLLTGMNLYYNSNDYYQSVTGIGWNHSYDYRLEFNIDGKMLFKDPSGSRKIYRLNGNTYVSEIGDDTSVLVRNADNSYTISEVDGSSMTFGQDGYITGMRDQYGNSLAFTYNAYGTFKDLMSVSDGIRSISFEYDTSVTPHRLNTVRDPLQNPYSIQYDSNGLIWHLVYPVTDSGVAAAFWEFTYTPQGTLSTKLDPAGNLTQYDYDGDRVSGATDPQGRTRAIAYPTTTDNVRSSTFVEKDGGAWTYTYDVTTGRLKEKVAPSGSTTTYTHYSNGRDKSKTDPGINGIRYTTFYTYDANGNMITESQPIDCAALGIDPAAIDDPSADSRIKVAFRYSYESAGQNRILSQSDVRGTVPLTTSYQYTTDADGYLVTTVTDPVGNVTVTRQYQNGSTKDVTDANRVKTTYTYRADWLPESVTGPDGTVTWFTGYDANGNNTEQQVKDRDGTVRQTIRMEYDARNRLRKSTTIAVGQPDVVTSYNYDNNDNLNYTKDAEQHETRHDYNYNRQVTATTQYIQNGQALQPLVTGYEYGGSGGAGCPSCGSGGGDKLTAVIDAKQQTTTFEYDQQGRLILETDPMQKQTQYTYYENDLLREKIDATTSPGKVLVDYYYDPQGRLTKKHYANNTDESYTYDPNGRMQTATNANIGYTFAYYDNGWLKSVIDTSGRVISYDQYDGIGQKKLVTLFPGTTDQRQTIYAYDLANLNRIKTITSTAGTFTYGYDNLGRRNSLVYPNGTSAGYSYDDLERLTSLAYNSGATPFLTYGYTHDQVGNRKTRTGNSPETYAYDEIYRLKQAVTATGTKNYTYDAVGNRQSGPGAKDTGYQYDAANRLTAGRLFNYAYDNNGNQIARTTPNTTDKGWTLTWDYENRLTKMEQSKGTTEKRTITFKYDPLGRRIEKKLVATVNGVTKTTTYTYVYDGDNIALEILVDGTAAPVKTFYTHGLGTDEHLALERNGQFYYYHADGLGSVTAITDQAKNVVQSYTYDSFGMVKSSTGFGNSYTYTGREWDRETGLFYYRARYYDPMEGRFIQKDPIGFKGGDTNLYGYTENNPINAIDPLGLFKLFGKEINFNLGSGLQAGLQLFLLGLNGSVGGIIGTDGQKCGVLTICGRIGPGLYAGGGAYGTAGGTLGNTSNVGGWSVGGGLDAGWGASTGGQAVIGLSSIGGTGPIPKVKAGGGFGANAGVDVCYTFTLLCSCPSK